MVRLFAAQPPAAARRINSSIPTAFASGTSSRAQGPAIVLMHGYTGTLDRHFIANGVFANLAKDHRAIAIDLRGHGKSGKPHDPRPMAKNSRATSCACSIT